MFVKKRTRCMLAAPLLLSNSNPVAYHPETEMDLYLNLQSGRFVYIVLVRLHLTVLLSAYSGSGRAIMTA